MDSISKISEEELLSKTIQYLRFPLIVGVVFIHTSISKYVTAENDITVEKFPILFYVTNLFSDVLARVAVPLFFFISGFLFFFKVENFTSKIYIIKLKKRVRSLVIPYLFWNVLLFLVYLFLFKIPIFDSLFNKPTEIPNLFQGLVGITAKDGFAYPIVPPFWFIRDLIVCVVISPILFIIITRTHHIGIILLGIGWFLGLQIPYIGVRGFNVFAFFFFSVGGWFACYKKNIIIISRELWFVALTYPLLVILDLITKGNVNNIYIHKLAIFVGILFWFLIVAFLIEKRGIKTFPFLASASFFIYAIHPWILSFATKIIFLYIHPYTEYLFVLIYFFLVLLTITIAVAIYWVLKKTIPSFTALITGGR